jgi:hypothetical protein
MRLTEQPFQVREASMPVNLHRGAAEPAAVHNAGVIEFITHDAVNLVYQRRNYPYVGGVAGRKYQRRFAALKMGHSLL